ncbi:MAG: type VI secretion system protein TssA [Burkholderiales bacterium]|nr:type VI secretion system protein TssA [Burkholderiales bacterium]
MSDIDAARNQVTGWLQPLTGDAAPSGPDLEYDNEFLAVVQAAAGKPESQFGPAEAPDWRAVVEGCEALFERSRDLRIAILWLRAIVHTLGWGALVPGLALVSGLVESSWDTLHPLPDPDDGDPYARVNALTLLRENEGLIGDLRASRIIAERSIGELSGRAAEVALGLSPARSEESDLGRGTVAQMLEAAVGLHPELGAQCREAAQQVRALISLLNDKLGVGTAPDLRPLDALVAGVASLLPSTAEAAAEEAGAAGEAQPAGAAPTRRGLSGAVTSREEAIRAIDMVCEYLERAEPTNPAPLFLRRARQLVSHNFLQLMKVLAPDALAEVARVVGIDPDSVETPDGS